jgi:hypothetical protein
VWGSGSIAPPFLTSTIDGGEWSASRLGCFTRGFEYRSGVCVAPARNPTRILRHSRGSGQANIATDLPRVWGVRTGGGSLSSCFRIWSRAHAALQLIAPLRFLRFPTSVSATVFSDVITYTFYRVSVLWYFYFWHREIEEGGQGIKKGERALWTGLHPQSY